MELNQQRFPHKYLRRVKKDGRWVYAYADDKARTYSQAVKDTKEYKVVIAEGKPTSIFVDSQSFITFGPPQTIGKRLFINTKGARKYWGIARSEDSSVYLYSEKHLEDVKTQKAAKFLLQSRALRMLDRYAIDMMNSNDVVDNEYGLAIWLANNSHLRIGAHESAGSVEPKERSAILAKARKEGWTDKEKADALREARSQTFGLLTLRRAAVVVDPKNETISFNFVGKGGKLVQHPPIPFPLLPRRTFDKLNYNKRQEDKVFSKINYKRIWRTYKKFGVTPHATRGAFAESMVNQLIKDYQFKEDTSGRVAVKKFNDELTQKVSEHLHHSKSMTERSYISSTTQEALNEFRKQLAEHGTVVESDQSDDLDSLAEAVLWLELGVGNTVA